MLPFVWIFALLISSLSTCFLQPAYSQGIGSVVTMSKRSKRMRRACRPRQFGVDGMPGFRCQYFMCLMQERCPFQDSRRKKRSCRAGCVQQAEEMSAPPVASLEVGTTGNGAASKNQQCAGERMPQPCFQLERPGGDETGESSPMCCSGTCTRYGAHPSLAKNGFGLCFPDISESTDTNVMNPQPMEMKADNILQRSATSSASSNALALTISHTNDGRITFHNQIY